MYGHKYTDAERGFFIEYVPGHSHKEIREEFIKVFDWEITMNQVKGYIKNNHLNTGRTGHFPKGHIPANKGRKGTCAAGCEKTWFCKGHTPINHRPVGSERISKDGYIEIKVAEPSKWRLKHRVIWEEYYGSVPHGKCIIFLNGDKTDVNIENLVLIDRAIHARMNQSGLRFADADSTKAAVAVGELMSVIGTAKKRK